MKILETNPPHNIRELCEGKFQIEQKVVFTYGDTIYNPFKGYVDPALEAHETVHSIQQGDDPLGWWNKYFVDSKFRFEQELQAYRVQYDFLKQRIKDRNTLARVLHSLALDISSPIYGKIVELSEAKRLIRGGDTR